MATAYTDFMRKHKLEYDADVEKAFALAERAHEGQLRNSGDPFFTHPLAVADIIAELGLDSTTIIGGILHDSVEDTQVNLNDIEAAFSAEIANLVDGVTKLEKYQFQSREEQQSESVRKMFLAMAHDIRVVIIKLADRLHNMRTLKYQSEDKQFEKAKETLDIYAPLAHQLGMSTIQWELEDLSLKFLSPDDYYEIAYKIAQSKKPRESQLDSIITKLEDKLSESRIQADLERRPKHIYSIYKKMLNKHKTFDELYDLIAIRIIVNNINDCYAALGLVHTLWRPIPNRFKDYIALPKKNMYQSLHTTLLGEDGRPFEVQIRTREMHRTAEYGITAHWKYNNGKPQDTDISSNLVWLKELMEWQNEVKDSKEFMETLKIDVFSDHVLVFTPKGEMKDFVNGATPLDFAYSIHSDIGNNFSGARVNGKLVPYDYRMHTGDVVEILTSDNSSGPNRDWLKSVKTTQARAKIRQWFKKELKEENILRGKKQFDNEAKRQGYRSSDLLRPEWLNSLFERFTLKSQNDMFSALGYGAITVHQVINRLIEQYKRANDIIEPTSVKFKDISKRTAEELSIDGNEGMVIRFAKCCNPVPGDDIVGYITRNRGVCVHTRECKNIQDIGLESERLIDVSWTEEYNDNSKYNVEVQIVAEDRLGLMMEITQILFNTGRELTSINANTGKNGQASILLRSNITSVNDLQDMMDRLKALKGVQDVFRVNY